MKQNKTIFKAVGGAAYSSPECNIISVKAEGMLCQSGGQQGFEKFGGEIDGEDLFNY